MSIFETFDIVGCTHEYPRNRLGLRSVNGEVSVDRIYLRKINIVDEGADILSNALSVAQQSRITDSVDIEISLVIENN